MQKIMQTIMVLKTDQWHHRETVQNFFFFKLNVLNFFNITAVEIT